MSSVATRSSAPSPVDIKSPSDFQLPSLISPLAFGLSKNLFPMSPSIKDEDMFGLIASTKQQGDAITISLKKIVEFEGLGGQALKYPRVSRGPQYKVLCWWCEQRIHELAIAEHAFSLACRKEIALFEKGMKDKKTGEGYDVSLPHFYRSFLAKRAEQVYHKSVRARILAFIDLVDGWLQIYKRCNFQLSLHQHRCAPRDWISGCRNCTSSFLTYRLNLAGR